MFREADPIVGGREHVTEDGRLEEGAQPSDWQNNFQARYIIRHRWDGPVDCADPVYGVWGADPNSADPWGQPPVSTNPSPNTAGGDVFPVQEDVAPVEQLVREDIPQINLTAEVAPKNEPSGCSATNTSSKIAGTGLFALIGLVGFGWRRRRRTH